MFLGVLSTLRPSHTKRGLELDISTQCTVRVHAALLTVFTVLLSLFGFNLTCVIQESTRIVQNEISQSQNTTFQSHDSSFINQEGNSIWSKLRILQRSWLSRSHFQLVSFAFAGDARF